MEASAEPPISQNLTRTFIVHSKSSALGAISSRLSPSSLMESLSFCAEWMSLSGE